MLLEITLCMSPTHLLPGAPLRSSPTELPNGPGAVQSDHTGQSIQSLGSQLLPGAVQIALRDGFLV